MLKTERIEQYKGVFLRPGHAAFLNRSFAMTPAADADVVLDGGEDNLNLLLRVATGRGLAGSGDDLFQLPRVGIWRTTHMIRFFQKCLTGHEDRRRG